MANDDGREATAEIGGVTWRAEVDAVDNVRVARADELLFVGYMSAGTIRFWEHPEDVNDEALTALDAALAKEGPTS